MDGEKSSERDCEGDAWVRVVRKKEKEMEIGFAGFLFFVQSEMKKKKEKNEKRMRE